MEVHVFSAGQNPQNDYSLEGITSPAIANAANALEATGLTLNEDGEDLAFVYRDKDAFVVLLNNIVAYDENERPLDYQKRFIRASVAWSLSSEVDARRLFGTILLCFKARHEGTESPFSESVLDCIRWDIKLPRGYEWNADCLAELVPKVKKAESVKQTLEAGREVWTLTKHQLLCDELIQNCFPHEELGFLCIVANQKARLAFQEAKVWRALTLGYESKAAGIGNAERVPFFSTRAPNIRRILDSVAGSRSDAGNTLRSDDD